MDIPSVLNGLDLFSGIGGITLALAPWVRPVAYCENDRYAQAVLLSRMADGSLPVAPIWDDVRTLRGQELPSVDIVYGGFPCTDISCAGRGEGLDGERSGLFFEIVRIVEETRPAFVFLENVPAIRTRGLGRVAWELAALGYDLRWTIVSAAEVGAPHLRERWFCLAADPDRIGVRKLRRWSSRALRQGATQFVQHGAGGPLADSGGSRKLQPSRRFEAQWGRACDVREAMAYGDGEGLEVGKQGDARQFASAFGGGWWATEPDVGRVAHGIPARVDRIKCLGNAVVPAQAREAFMRLMGMTGCEQVAQVK